MTFTQTTGSHELLEYLGVRAEAKIEVTGRLVLVNLTSKAALLPMPTAPDHANFPPTVPCLFFAYGVPFRVNHTFRNSNPKAKHRVETEIFMIEVARDFTYFKRRRILRLCQDAMRSYLGADYFGNEYEIELALTPMHRAMK